MVEGSRVIAEGGIDNARRRSSKGRSSLLRRVDWQGPNGMLYDRREQQQALRDAYYRSKQQAEIVIITGASGTGKTALANALCPLVEDDGGLFFRGKFDQHQYLAGLSPCLQAFRFFAKRILSRSKEECDRVKKAIEEDVGSEISLLLNVIPELGELLTPELWRQQQEKAANNSGMDSSVSSQGGFAGEFSDSQARVVSVFRRFLHCCSSRERPVVLFMDDLQVRTTRMAFTLVHWRLFCGLYRSCQCFGPVSFMLFSGLMNFALPSCRHGCTRAKRKPEMKDFCSCRHVEGMRFPRRISWPLC